MISSAKKIRQAKISLFFAALYKEIACTERMIDREARALHIKET